MLIVVVSWFYSRFFLIPSLIIHFKLKFYGIWVVHSVLTWVISLFINSKYCFINRVLGHFTSRVFVFSTYCSQMSTIYPLSIILHPHENDLEIKSIFFYNSRVSTDISIVNN